MLGLCRSDACHGKQETRVDPVIARFDAFAAEHAVRGPFARRIGTPAGAHDVEHAADDVFWVRFANAGRPYARTDLDTLAAFRAGVEHVVDAVAESRLEGDIVHRLQIQRFSQIGLHRSPRVPARLAHSSSATRPLPGGRIAGSVV